MAGEKNFIIKNGLTVGSVEVIDSSGNITAAAIAGAVNEGIDDQVNSLLVGGTGISLTYDDSAGTLTIDGQVGDITGVTAGTGLSGGGTSGTVSLAVDFDNVSDGATYVKSTNDYTDADVSKLSAIESSATADQTDAEIRTAVEAATDSNVFTDADHTKLNAIEASATADQTNAEIRTAVEAATDSNVFTDADHTKLNAIEALADVTDTANVVAALSAGTGITISGAGSIAVSALAITTVQTAANQSAHLALTAQEGDVVVRSDENKSYIHNSGSAGTMADYTLLSTPTDSVLSVDGLTGAVTLNTSNVTENSSYKYYTEGRVSANTSVAANTAKITYPSSASTKLAGIEESATADQTDAEIRTAVEAATDSNVFTDADHTKLNAIEASATADQTAAEIRTAVEAATDSNVFTDADHSKLNAIEASATADQTGAQIKALYEAETNAYTDTKNTKLAGIETSATADQTDAEIRTAVEAATDSNVFTDADHTKLNAIEALADVTDATNVAASGAVMESDSSTVSMSFVADEDNMVSNSATKLATQQSIKAYVDSQVAGKDNTDEITEGSTNLYHTTARARSSISAGGDLAYNSTTGVISFTNDAGDISSVVAGDGLTGGGTAGDVTLNVNVDDSSIETNADTVRVKALGITNAMLAGSIANEKLANSSITVNGNATSLGGTVILDTSDLSEVTNLFHTTERVQDVVGTMIVGGTGITSTYNDTAGTLTLTSQVGDITSVVAGSGLSGGGTTGDVTLTLDTGAVFQEAVADTVGAMVISNTESGITVTYDDADNTLDFTIGTLNQNTTGNALTATTLATARTLGGVSFDGSASINLPGVNSAGNQSTSGLAGTATALATARTIHGVSFDGTANISLTEEIQDTVGAMFTSNTESGITVAYDDADGTVDFTVGTLNQNTSGNAATVTNGVYTTGNQTIAGVKTFSSAIVSDLTGNVTGNVSGTAGSATGNAGTVTNGVYTTGTQTIGGAKTFSSAILGDLTGNVTGNTSGSSGSTTGNAATATALATARTIQGVSFDGTAAITTLTAGTGVSVSGTEVSIGQTVGTSSNVTFGDLTLSGNLTVNGTTTSVASTNTTMTDGLIELANGTTGTPANDTGIVIERGTAANAFMGWDESADKFTMGTGTFTGASTGSLSITTGTLVANLEGNVTGNTSGSSGSTTGNAATATVLQTARTIGGTSFNGSANIAVALAATATTLATARTITLGGDLSGSASFNGGANITISAVVADDSHNHTIANVDLLQTALDAKYASGSNATLGTITTSNAANAGGYVRNMFQSTSSPVAGDGAIGDMWVLYS